MAMGIRATFEECRSIDHTAIGAAFMSVGDALKHPARMILCQNFTDADLMVSIDGVTDHVPIRKNGGIVYDLSANKTLSDGLFLSEGTQFYVRQIIASTRGSFYISVVYAQGTEKGV